MRDETGVNLCVEPYTLPLVNHIKSFLNYPLWRDDYTTACLCHKVYIIQCYVLDTDCMLYLIHVQLICHVRSVLHV